MNVAPASDPLEVTERYFAMLSAECSLLEGGVKPMYIEEFVDESVQLADTEGVVDMAVTRCMKPHAVLCNLQYVRLLQNLFGHLMNCTSSTMLGQSVKAWITRQHLCWLRSIRPWLFCTSAIWRACSYLHLMHGTKCCLQLICNLN